MNIEFIDFVSQSVGIGVYAAAFNLRTRRLIEQAAYDGTAAGSKSYFASPRARKWRKRHRNGGYGVEFRDLVDAIVAGCEAAAPSVEEKKS